jgi:hypothetical protein
MQVTTAKRRAGGIGSNHDGKNSTTPAPEGAGGAARPARDERGEARADGGVCPGAAGWGGHGVGVEAPGDAAQ